jgi:hypothetical protein
MTHLQKELLVVPTEGMSSDVVAFIVVPTEGMSSDVVAFIVVPTVGMSSDVVAFKELQLNPLHQMTYLQ